MIEVHNLKCTSCKKDLVGKQKKFCSNSCKAKSSNNKHQNYVNQQRRGAARKIRLMQMKEIKCMVCGYNKNYAALSFHHRDPKTKSHSLDLRNCSNKSWNSLIKEADKCDLVCMNCHMEIHHPELDANSSNNKMNEFIFFNKTEVNQHLLSPTKCKFCKKEYQPCKRKRKYCSEKCYVLNSRKVKNRPAINELQKEIAEVGFVQVGKKYGVSDNAVRKWLK